MSKLRNTPGAPQRRRNTAFAASALVAGAVAAGLLAACSSDAHSPTAPETAKAPAALIATLPAAPWNSTDASRQYPWSTFASMLATWRTQASDTQSGTRFPDAMQCVSFSNVGSASKSLTASAYPQSMSLGRTTVTFPAGSVPSNVTVTLNASYTSQGIKLDFQPHGYKFNKAIQIDANYNGCSFRYSSPLNLFYLNDSGGIIQTMPSSDDRQLTTLHGLTDHFSGFMVAWTSR